METLTKIKKQLIDQQFSFPNHIPGFRLWLSFYRHSPCVLKTLKSPTSQHYTSTSEDLVAYAKAHDQSTGFSKSYHNCGYYPRVLLEEDVNPYMRFHSAKKLADELKKLIEICCQNLFHTQKL